MNIFDALDAMTHGKYDWRDRLSDEDRDELDKFTRYSAIRWLSGTTDKKIADVCILSANEANINYAIYDPELRWMSLCAIGLRISYRYKWTNFAKQTFQEKLATLIWPSANLEDRRLAIELFDTETLISKAKLCGIQNDQIAELRK